ncbi:hypothetical protein N7490_000010 [Penicillium lividum]|nr:hypothetical protein N7490_000010 [Penicillium lividum]
MTLLHRGFTLAILFLFLSALFVDGSWARIRSLNTKSTFINAGNQLNDVALSDAKQVNALAKRGGYSYNECMSRGKKLTCAMKMSNDDAEDSFGKSVVATYTTTTQLDDNGWTIAYAWDDLQLKLVDYIGEEFLAALNIDTSNNVVKNWEHTVTKGNYPATEANYQCWYNAENGAIFVESAFGPGYKKIEMVKDKKWPSGGKLPELRQLSDVMWIEWAVQASANTKVLKYIFRVNVVNLDTRNVMNEAMGGNWDEPGVFSPDSDEFWALLGTPNGNAQAWILINHKDSLGIKTISKIRVWSNGPEDLCFIPELEDDDECYRMLFYVTDADVTA